MLRNRLFALENTMALVAHHDEFADIGVILQESESVAAYGLVSGCFKSVGKLLEHDSVLE